MIRFVLFAITFASCAAPCHADLVWNIVDDGNGNMREIITGSIDLSGGPTAPSGSGEFFGGFPFFDSPTADTVRAWRIVGFSPAGDGSRRTFAGDAGNPTTMVNAGFAVGASGWVNAQNLFMQVDNANNEFVGFAYDSIFGAGLTSINEDSVYNVPFTRLNQGTWKYGNTTDAIQGNGVTFVVGPLSSVPEPGSLSLLGVALFGLGMRRRRT